MLRILTVWIALAAWMPADQVLTPFQSCEVEVYFSLDAASAKALRDRVIELVGGAKSRVWVLAYTLSDKDLLEALRLAQNKGLDLKILMDPEQYEDLRGKDDVGATLEALRGQSTLKLAQLPPEGRLHTKMILIDDRTLIAGSKNWSDLDASAQWNDLIVIHDVKGPMIKPCREAFADFAQPDPWPTLAPYKPAGGASKGASEARAALATCLPGEADPPVRAEILAMVENAQERLFLTQFIVNDSQILELVAKKAEAKKVAVRVALDRIQVENLGRRKDSEAKKIIVLLDRLRTVGALRLSPPKQQIHSKLAVIDDVIVTGSANWSKAAWEKNGEILFFLTPRGKGKILESYLQYSESVWSRCEDQ